MYLGTYVIVHHTQLATTTHAPHRQSWAPTLIISEAINKQALLCIIPNNNTPLRRVGLGRGTTISAATHLKGIIKLSKLYPAAAIAGARNFIKAKSIGNELIKLVGRLV